MENLYLWFAELDPILQALLATLFTWFVTALGAAMVFFFKTIKKSVLNSMRIKTIEELVMLKPSDLANSPYTNVEVRNELQDNLKQKGLAIGMSRYEMCDYSSDQYVRITEDSEGNPMFRPIF